MELPFSRRLLYAILSGGLVCLSFPNFLEKTLTPPTALLAWIALVPFFLALKGSRPGQGAFLGWVFGMVHFCGILYWIAVLEEAKYLSGLAWFALCLYLSLYFLLFGWIYCRLTARWERFGPWAAPAAWVALEYIRGTRPWGGFSWCELGYSQAPYPVLLAVTTIGGVYGLTFLMVWFNASLAEAFSLKDQKPAARRALLAAPFVVLTGAVLWGYYETGSARLTDRGTAALLQPSVDQSLKWDRNNEKATYDLMETLVRSLPAERPGLIVWPETAAPAYLRSTPEALARVSAIARASRVPNLVGCLDAERGAAGEVLAFNAAAGFGPDGLPFGIYHKRHLVPFGEFVPFQKYLTWLGPIVGDLGNFGSGASYRTFPAAGFTYTPLICYEATFPGDVRMAARTGADVLVNISNDAWYGRTAAAYQHAMMSVVRAAEERKPLLRSANTGISLATDPFGSILSSTALFERRVLVVPVRTASGGGTLYYRTGNWVPWVCWAALVLILAASLRRAAAPLQRPGGDDPAPPRDPSMGERTG